MKKKSNLEKGFDDILEGRVISEKEFKEQFKITKGKPKGRRTDKEVKKMGFGPGGPGRREEKKEMIKKLELYEYLNYSTKGLALKINEIIDWINKNQKEGE